jgi:hypothetical protein
MDNLDDDIASDDGKDDGKDDSFEHRSQTVAPNLAKRNGGQP